MTVSSPSENHINSEEFGSPFLPSIANIQPASQQSTNESFGEIPNYQTPAPPSKSQSSKAFAPLLSAAKNAISSPFFCPSKTTKAGTPDRLPVPNLPHSDPLQILYRAFTLSASPSANGTDNIFMAAVRFRISSSDRSLGT
mmetsp:Transcript_19369/g.39953  ORF Transcript_19369/g.39953 Transcript_19369/m.39953 type:complete len:141 (-) Transcript_19369:442-864(-)